MERKYTVTIRMVDTKEQIVVESQCDSRRQQPRVADVDLQNEPLRKPRRDGIALLILYLTGLLYVLIHTFSFLTEHVDARPITTLSMAVFSLVAGALSWFEILPFPRLARFAQDNLPVIFVFLLYISLAFSGIFYFHTDAVTQAKLAGDVPNALTWVAIMNMYFFACTRHLRRFLISDNGRFLSKLRKQFAKHT